MVTDKDLIVTEPDRDVPPVRSDEEAARRVRGYLDGPVSLAETARARVALAALDTAIRDLAAAHGIGEDALADRLDDEAVSPHPSR